MKYSNISGKDQLHYGLAKKMNGRELSINGRRILALTPYAKSYGGDISQILVKMKETKRHGLMEKIKELQEQKEYTIGRNGKATGGIL